MPHISQLSSSGKTASAAKAQPSVNHHWKEEDLPSGQVRRTIASCCNYKTPGGIWAATDSKLEGAGAKPVDWPLARWDFQHQVTRQPLQVYFGKDVAGGAPALIGVCSDERPSISLVMIPWGVTNKAVKPEPTEIAVHWDGIWPNTELWYRSGPGRLDKELRLMTADTPLSFQFALQPSPQAVLSVSADGMDVRDVADGASVLRLQPPWGRDANGVDVRCTLRAGSGVVYRGENLPTVWIDVNSADLVGATYPVTIDPTTTITGSSAIEDNNLRTGGANNNNWGASAYLNITYDNNGVMRFSASLIPAGTLTAFRLSIYTTTGTGNGAQLNVYFIKDANTWVEGTKNGTVETGSSCWQYAKYNTQSWAGSLGCSKSGTDYDANASPPTMTLTVNARQPSLALPVAWVTAWRDATRVNNGIVIRGVASLSPFFYSSDQAPPQNAYFEIDYAASCPLPVIGMVG